MKSLPKIIAIVGPTASGKSDLAVILAKKIGGEIISVDSRQIYRGMDLGTGKITKAQRKNVPHWGIDIVNPETKYSTAKFQILATKTIKKIIRKGKVPILAGGTAHWMDNIVNGLNLPPVPPNSDLRKKLAKLTALELFTKLKKLDPARSKTIDSQNPRRLARAIEIVLATGKPVTKLTAIPTYESLQIGIKIPMEILAKRIKSRLDIRIKKGLINEVRKLHLRGVSWKRLESFGLEYKLVSHYLQNKISRAFMEQQLVIEIRQYAKRQLSWWKRNPNIIWIKNTEIGKVTRLAKTFLK